MKSSRAKLLRLCLRTESPAKALFLASLGCLLGSFLLILSLQCYFDSNRLKGDNQKGGSFVTLNKKVKGGLLLNLSSTNKAFSKEEIDQIQKISGVQDLGEFSRNHFPVTVHIWPAGRIGLGAAARADLFFESVPNRFLDQIPESWAWEQNHSYVPIMVPKFYLDLWNFGLAPSRDEYPALSLEAATSMPIEIFMGQNRSKRMIGRFVAFSKRINSVLVPEKFLKWANQDFATEENQDYFFVWNEDEIDGQPISFSDLKKFPKEKLNRTFFSSLYEPSNMKKFNELKTEQLRDSEVGRLIVRLKDTKAEQFFKKITEMGYETNREMPQNGWIHRAAIFTAWIGGGLGGFLSLLSMGTFTSSFRLMIVQSAESTKKLIHLGFSKSQISKVFFVKFAQLFLSIWTLSLVFGYITKVILEKNFLTGLGMETGLSWQTYLIAIIYATAFTSINYWVIDRAVSDFSEKSLD